MRLFSLVQRIAPGCVGLTGRNLKHLDVGAVDPGEERERVHVHGDDARGVQVRFELGQGGVEDDLADDVGFSATASVAVHELDDPHQT